MKIKMLLMVMLSLYLFLNCSDEKIAKNSFFVSPAGNDNWSGKQAGPAKDNTDGPFATFAKAQQAVRDLQKSTGLPDGGVTVYVRGGHYSLSQTIQLTAQDSGTETAPVTWRAYPGEKVILSGGKRLSGFTKITDENILKRLNTALHDSILVCDLKKLNISDYGKLQPKGYAIRPQKPLEMELFFNAKAMTLARYPNDGWLKIADVPQFGKKLVYKGGVANSQFGIPAGRHYGRFVYDTDRPNRWQSSDDIWMHGYWTWDWADTFEKVAGINKAKKEIYLAAPYSRFGYTKAQRYYFLNVLEELDTPGEYYIDRKAGALYFYPPADITNAEVSVSIMEAPLLVLDNSSFINMEGFIFECSRTTALQVLGGNNNKIAGCVFRNLGNTAVVIDGGHHNGILSCDIYETAAAGIELNGGDRMTLTPGNNYAENNEIYDFGLVFRTYNPAIRLNGVGNRLAHNFIHDAPHAGVLFYGNENILEYNEVCDIAKETGDVGGFYMGRDWTCRNNMVRYNYFHHLHGPGLHGVRAVYLDDYASGTTIFGNIFYQAGRAAFIGGGRDNLVENNVFIECNPSVQVDGRGLSWAKRCFDKSDPNYTSVLFDRMDAVNFSQPPYSEKYPVLLKLYDDDPAVPKHNKIIRNVSYGGRFIDLYDNLDFNTVLVQDNVIADSVIFRGSRESDQSSNFQTYKFGDKATMEKMKGNKFVDGNPGIQDVANKDFRLKKDSPAFEMGFQEIPVDKIGLYKDKYRKNLEK